MTDASPWVGEGRVTVLPDHDHDEPRFPGHEEIGAAVDRAVAAGERDVAVVVGENSTPDPEESADYATVVDRAADGLIEAMTRRRANGRDRLLIQTGPTDAAVSRDDVLAHLRGEELGSRPDVVLLQDLDRHAKFRLEGTPAAMLEALMARRNDRFAPGESTAARAAGTGHPEGDVRFLDEDASHPQVRAAKERVEAYKERRRAGDASMATLKRAWADQTLRRDRALRDRVTGLIDDGVAPGSIVVRRGAAHPAAKLLADAGVPVEYGYEKGGLLHAGSAGRVSNERRAREDLERTGVPYADWARVGPDVAGAIRDHNRSRSVPGSPVPQVPDLDGDPVAGGDVPDPVAVANSLVYGAPPPDRDGAVDDWLAAMPVADGGARSSGDGESWPAGRPLPHVPDAGSTAADDATPLVDGLAARVAEEGPGSDRARRPVDRSGDAGGESMGSERS